MRSSVRGNRVVAILLVLLVCALGALAVMQYRWIDRFSAAERQRRREDAEFVVRRLANELNREVQRTFLAFLAAEDADVAPLYQDWLRSAPWPDLVQGVYAAERKGNVWTLHRLDPTTQELVEVTWPEALQPLRPLVEGLGTRSPEPNWPPPLDAKILAMLIVQRPARYEPEFLHAVPLRAMLLRFDRDVFTRTIMPGLVEQVTGGDEPRFDVSVVAGDQVIFRSNPAWPQGDLSADVSAAVSSRPDERLGIGRGPRGPRHGMQGDRPPRPQGPRYGKGPPESERLHGDNPRPGEEAGAPPPEAEMRVLVRHRAGGLDALVASTRTRNLAMSAGILAILLAAVAMLVVLLRRGERLRAQEAAFVSVMSHELNTPVAVLRSAGENIKDGIVGADQIPLYGQTIVDEADRLKHMIGEVLELAGMQARTEARPHRTVAIAPIVEAAVERCRLLANGALQIEADIEPDLPPVAADDDALGRAIQNLIVNAIRHGGSGGWVGVRARRDGKRVTITVEDRGPGIHANDIAQVFEPFYRGRGSGSVSGAGLGLTIVKQIAVDHGGSVTLDRRDAGAAFTIHLPAEVGRA